jgi:metallo-beta-lactamase family protein
MESTYGDREHDDPEHVEAKLCSIINETVEVGGNVLIPTFAVERAQELLFHLSRLARERKIPYLMTFLDSPMAVEITKVFENCKKFFDRETLDLFAKRESPFDFPGLRLVRTAEESKLINHIKGSVIIMAGSGMLTGGRIKHHLVRNIVRPESTVIFVGYQANGTLGRLIIDGAPEVRIHGQHHKVKARIERIMGFSAHAGRSELLRWAGHFELSPIRTFVTHGEEEASNSLAEHLRSRKDCRVEVPEYLEEFEL